MPTEEGDKLWLSAEEAENIECTLINREYAKDVFGMELPNRNEKTSYDEKVLISYYITPKGKVFCWPPFLNGNKSYIGYDLTIKDYDGNEISGTDATNASKYPTLIAHFSDTGEEITISNEDSNENIFRHKEKEINYTNSVSDEEKEAFEKFESKMYSMNNSTIGILTDKINNNDTKTLAQLYNYLARGGEKVVDEKEVLEPNEAEEISCTLINKEYAKDTFGYAFYNLQEENVKTNYEKDISRDYYITPKGTIFCWPPYVYDGKSYVNMDKKVKDINYKDIDGTDATNYIKNPTVMIYIDGKIITINNTENSYKILNSK